MVVGDDERREKDQSKREAAFARWESRGERARRRVTEFVVDGFDRLLGMVLALAALPVRLLARGWRGVRKRLGGR